MPQCPIGNSFLCPLANLYSPPAPVPRKKDGRAARLLAIMERDGHAGGPMIKSEGISATPESTTPAETTEE